MTKTVLTTMRALLAVKAKIEEMENNPFVDKKILKDLNKALEDLNLQIEMEEKILSMVNFIDPDAFVIDEEESEEEEEKEEQAEEEEVQEEEKEEEPAPQFQKGNKINFGKKPAFVKV